MAVADAPTAWGRFVSSEDSLVWIDWQGEHSISFADYNGRVWELLSISDSEAASHM